MSKKGWRALLLGLVFVLASCAPNLHWVKSHPTYSLGSPLGEVGVPDLGDRWILVRGSWFADQLKLDPSSVYDTIGLNLREDFVAALQNVLPSTTMIPAGVIDSFPEPEAVQLDSRIYFKGRLPAQGQTILVDQFAVKRLLIIHELTLGPNLSKESLYDYEKANVEGDSRPKKPRDLKAIATWTLWDNRTQHPLISGISESSLPYENQKGPELRSLIYAVTIALAQNIQKDMGVSP